MERLIDVYTLSLQRATRYEVGRFRGVLVGVTPVLL